MKEDQTIISLKNVSKTFYIRDNKPQPFFQKLRNTFSGNGLRRIEAVKNVSIDIKKGEFVGIVGNNGSGKSTLLNLMAAVYQPDKGGEAYIYGNFMKLSLGLGFNAQLSARENIYINASIMGLTFAEIRSKFNEIIKFAELEKFVDTKIKFYSRGMKVRLGFAIAIHTESDILFLDEIFGGVGDEKFKLKSEQAFQDSLIKGRTIVLVSHNMSPLRDHANKVLFMHEGKCIKIGDPEEVISFYHSMVKVKNSNQRERTQEMAIDNPSTL